MINQLIVRVREGVFDTVDAAIEVLTLGEYGYEPVSDPMANRDCEARERLNYEPASVGHSDHALSPV